jgi:hypothetical protein
MAILETPSGTVNGTNPTFTAANSITTPGEQLFVDRVLQIKNTDYTISGSTITFLSGAIPQTGAALRLYYNPLGVTVQQTSTKYDTAGNIINDVAAEVGLGLVADPFSSTDANFVQLCRLLKSTGRMLTFRNDWTQLRGEFVFTTVANQSQYTLPPDFNNMIDQTGWNRTNRLPIGGPVDPQMWQYLKARLSQVVFNVLFRQMQGRWNLFPDTNTPSGYQIAFEYNSKWWVGGNLTTPSSPPAWAGGVAKTMGAYVTNGGFTYVALNAGTTLTTSGGPTGFGCSLDGTVIWKWYDAAGISTSDAPVASTDTIFFDSTMTSRALKLAFLQAKGFPSDAAQREFDMVFEQQVNTDRPAPVINLGGRAAFDPLIGVQSIPITGFGN